MFLTKSLFKLALECPSKLYYVKHREHKFFDASQDNDFLQSLAEGGQQIGELAKFKYHDDPVGQKITVDSLDHIKAVEQTQEMLFTGSRVVIAEAAFKHENFFIRVDLLIKDETSRTIDLIEVKSKSVTDDAVAQGFRNTRGKFSASWLPYLYDVTYQTMVARLAMPGYVIRPKLLLIDGQKVCSVDGLHQQFPIGIQKDDQGRVRSVVKPRRGLRKEEVGHLDLLREVDVGDVVNVLLSQPINNPEHIPNHATQSLNGFAYWASDLLKKRQRFFQGVSKTCKSCQFRAPVGSALESGLHECWKEAIANGLLQGDSSKMDYATPLSIDLWGGGAGAKSIAAGVLQAGRAFLRDIQEEDILVKTTQNTGKMSAFERRWAQVRSVSDSKFEPYLSEERLAEMDAWEWPLHMIDFETSAPAVPFFKGMRPYETLAFQFSHHVIERDGASLISVRHANQWISIDAQTFPTIAFVRALKQALMPEGELRGTVFRYHNHENTVLRNIRKLLIDDGPFANEPDADELISFIDLVTVVKRGNEGFKDGYEGPKAMVDLHRLVQEGYYSKHAGGSISLKYILPAVLKDAERLNTMYSKLGVYGKNLPIKSLNFDDHVWLQADKSNNPYKTLPPIFASGHTQLNEMLLRLAGDGEEDDGSIANGGVAMTAYNFTQFNALKPEERKKISEALLRYCELDTLAMVMVVQGLFELRRKPMKIL
jgi:hypothetical protein